MSGGISMDSAPVMQPICNVKCMESAYQSLNNLYNLYTLHYSEFKSSYILMVLICVETNQPGS